MTLCTKCTNAKYGERHELIVTEEMRALVKELAQKGLPHRQIRTYIINSHTNKPISEGALRKYFVHELDTGRGHLTSRLMSKIFEQAMEGDSKAQALVFNAYVAPLLTKELEDEIREAMQSMTKSDSAGFLRDMIKSLTKKKEQEHDH